MPDRLAEIRARLKASSPFHAWTDLDFDYTDADTDLINNAPEDILWLMTELVELRRSQSLGMRVREDLIDDNERLLEQVAWMEPEREKVINLLSDRSGDQVDADEVLFLFGLVRGRTADGDEWGGTCSCGAGTLDACACRKALA